MPEWLKSAIAGVALGAIVTMGTALVSLNREVGVMEQQIRELKRLTRAHADHLLEELKGRR